MDGDAALLGLPPDDDWVLAAPYSDKSLMRNVLAHRTARALGRYAPHTRFVELVLNGNYRGVYVLTQRIELASQVGPPLKGFRNLLTQCAVACESIEQFEMRFGIE